jgi:hypothetical protein
MNFKLFRLILTFTSLYSINGIRLVGIYRIYNKVYNSNIRIPDELLFLGIPVGSHSNTGCITSAGYSYCNHTDSCVRFDQPCVFLRIK